MDNFVEWYLTGGAQPLAITMNESVCLAVEVDQHVDASYEEAIEFAKEQGIKIPML